MFITRPRSNAETCGFQEGCLQHLFTEQHAQRRQLCGCFFSAIHCYRISETGKLDVSEPRVLRLTTTPPPSKLCGTRLQVLQRSAHFAHEIFKRTHRHLPEQRLMSPLNYIARDLQILEERHPPDRKLHVPPVEGGGESGSLQLQPRALISFTPQNREKSVFHFYHLVFTYTKFRQRKGQSAARHVTSWASYNTHGKRHALSPVSHERGEPRRRQTIMSKQRFRFSETKHQNYDRARIANAQYLPAGVWSTDAHSYDRHILPVDSSIHLRSLHYSRVFLFLPCLW